MASTPIYLSRLPRWLSHWLGYRQPTALPAKPLQRYLICLWSFIGAFGGLSILQAVFGHAQYFINRGVPPIIASFGASAVLCYGAVDVPFSQPRALIGGHFISALVGVCLAKLFHLLPDTASPDSSATTYEDVSWIAASLSTAISIVVMQITKTTHPPAGATALLPVIESAVWGIGWYYLPVVLLSSTLVLLSALLVNNVQRRYPVFWWTPSVPPATQPNAAATTLDLEKNDTKEGSRDERRIEAK